MHISLIEITKTTKLDLENFDLCVEARFTKGLIWPFVSEFKVVIYRYNPKIRVDMREHLPCHAVDYYYSSGEKVPRIISSSIQRKFEIDSMLAKTLEIKEEVAKEIGEHLRTQK